jgi:hypothetical protein
LKDTATGETYGQALKAVPFSDNTVMRRIESVLEKMTAFWDVAPFYFSDTTRLYIPESCNHHTRRCENLKSQSVKKNQGTTANPD